MTLRSRRKPPTTALNLIATATESVTWSASAIGLFLIACCLAFVLPAAAETKTDVPSQQNSSDQKPPQATHQSTLKIKGAQPKTRESHPEVSLAPLSTGAKDHTQIRVVSFGADSKTWEPLRPSNSASVHFAQDTSEKTGWVRSRGSNVQLSDTSTHLNWGPRDDSKKRTHSAVAGRALSTRNAASQDADGQTELPRRVGNMFQTPLALSLQNGERSFSESLNPPPSPLLSSIPKIAKQTNEPKLVPKQPRPQAVTADSHAAAKLKAAARLKAVASSTRSTEQPVHVRTPDVEPLKTIELTEPVARRVAEKASVQAKGLVANTSEGPQVVARGARTSAKEATQPTSNSTQSAVQNNTAKLETESREAVIKQPNSQPSELQQLAESPAENAGDQVQPVQHLATHQSPRDNVQRAGKFSVVPSHQQAKLRLPIANLRDGKSWQPQPRNAPFSAPMPSQSANDPNSRELRVAERFRFKDLTPLTKPVQGTGPSDDFFDLPPTDTGNSDPTFSLDDLSSPDGSNATDETLGSPEPNALQLTPLPDAPSENSTAPNVDLDQEFAEPLVDPDALPELGTPRLLPLDEAGSPSGRDASGANQNDTDSALEDVDALRKRIQEQLSELEDLPDVEGDKDAIDLDNIEDDSSPLFSDEDPAETATPTGELAATNGRDCPANAESYAKDMRYMARRQRTSEISLNVTPLLSPAEVDMAKAEQTRAEKMAKVPVRTFRDRRGNVIVDGQLDDFRDDQVVIRTVNGSYRSIPKFKLSDSDQCFVEAWWEIPPEYNFEDEQYEMRDFRLTTFTWAAAGTCHKPLYFEQVGVERYGHSSGPIVQPLISGVHFFGDIFMLPYHAGIHPQNECIYTLGHYRPGNCAPWLVPGFPISDHSIKWQGIALGAAISLLP